MDNGKSESLKSKNIPRLILGYSLTTFAALIVNSLYTLTDAIIVGQGIGAEALGGITAIMPFVMIQGAISQMLGGGAAILVSQLLGKNDKKTAGGIVLTAAITFWITALIITALGLIFINPLLNILGVADNLKVHAKQYLTIILIGTVFSTGFSSVMRAEGKMLYAMLQWVIPISIDIILDVILVFRFHYGVKGVAYSTLGCNIATFITSIIFFTKFSSLDFKGVKLKMKTLGDILTAGVPSLVQYGSIAVGMALLNNVFKTLGGESLQIIYAMVSKIFMFCIVPFTAITQALQPIAGYNYGAGKPERVKTAMNYTVLFSLAASLIPLILCELIPRLLLRILVAEDTIIAESIPALRWVAAALPFMFLPSAAGVLFQSTGKKFSAVLLFAASFLFVPPLAFLFGKLNGNVWISFPIAGAFASITAAVALFVFFKKYNKIPIQTMHI